MIPSPGIDPVCAFFGTKRVVAKSELLAGEAFVADVERNGVLSTLGLLLLFDVDLNFAGGSQLVSGPGMHADVALLHNGKLVTRALKQLGGETTLTSLCAAEVHWDKFRLCPPGKCGGQKRQL
jgi:hypothetical protein